MDEMKRKALAELERKTNNLMRAYLLRLTAQVVVETPVDTGRARSNWNVSVNKPDRRTFQVKGRGVSGAAERAAYETYTNQQKAENTRIGESVNFWDGQVGWLVNGLPYIMRLEKGWSRVKAPNGMVKISIEGLKPWFEKQVVKYGLR